MSSNAFAGRCLPANEFETVSPSPLRPIRFPAMNMKLATAGFFLAGLFACQLHAAQINLGSSTSRTPYDPYLSPVWEVFRKLGGVQPDRATVEKLVREGRGFRYVFKKEQPYVPQLPEQ